MESALKLSEERLFPSFLFEIRHFVAVLAEKAAVMALQMLPLSLLLLTVIKKKKKKKADAVAIQRVCQWSKQCYHSILIQVLWFVARLCWVRFRASKLNCLDSDIRSSN